MFQFVKDNFLLVTTSVLISSYLVACVFYFSFLYVFDYSLYGLIQYSDLNSLIIALAGFFAGSLAGLGFIESAYNSIFRDSKRIWPTFLFILIIPVLFLSPPVFVYMYTGVWLGFSYEIYEVTCWCVFISLLFFIKNDLIDRPFRFGLAVRLLSQSIALSASFGLFYGNYVRSTHNPHDIILKTTDNSFDELRNADIILLLSHHIIVRLGPKIVVIPMDGISRISRAY